jgi:signal transduction histidine kinase
MYLSAWGQHISEDDNNLKLFDVESNDSIRLELIMESIYCQNNPDSIISLSEQLIKVASQCSNSLYLAKAYYYKGCGLKLLSKYKDAIDAQFACIHYATDADQDLIIACSYLEVGYVYSSLKNRNQAISFFNKGIKMLNFLNNDLVIAGAYLNLGGEYLSRGDLDSSLIYFQNSGKVYQRISDYIGYAYARGNIGIVLAKKNNFDTARIELLASCERLKENRNTQVFTSFRLWLSIIEFRSNNFLIALRYVNEALRVALENNLKDQIRDSYEQLSSIYTAMGRYKEANEALKNYYAYRDSIVNTETITKIANLRTEFEVGQKQKELDKMAETDRFKTRVTWALSLLLGGVVVLLLVVYRNYRVNRRLLVVLDAQKQETERQKLQLEEVIAAKDRLFSVVAHDLRGPIGALGNLVILANDALANNELADLQSLLMLMGESNREVEALLNNLLHWSIGQRGAYQKKVESVDFNRLVNSVISVYSTVAFAKGVHIQFNQQYSEHQIDTDLNSWAVIVRNLINNAVKFTHLGGVVEVAAFQRDEMLELEISDTGIGMDPDFARNLFSATVHQSQWGTNREKGLGIGLSLVKDFVDLNGGTIIVNSVLGKGTSFKVAIPVVPVKATLLVDEMA